MRNFFKKWFLLYLVRKVITMKIKMKPWNSNKNTVNVSQLYSIPQFLRANVYFWWTRFHYIKGEKRRSKILRSRFLKDIIRKIWISSTKSWKIACFRCNTTENFIYSLKSRKRKVDLNTSKKSLVFVTIRHRKFHLYVQLWYTKNFIFTQKYTFAERCCFLAFSF